MPASIAASGQTGPDLAPRHNLPQPCANAPWCGRRDSNPHDLRHRNLNPARLPVPPRPRALHLPRCLPGCLPGCLPRRSGALLLWRRKSTDRPCRRAATSGLSGRLVAGWGAISSQGGVASSRPGTLALKPGRCLGAVVVRPPQALRATAAIRERHRRGFRERGCARPRRREPPDTLRRASPARAQAWHSHHGEPPRWSRASRAEMWPMSSPAPVG
jgi:hypothetical protein